MLFSCPILFMDNLNPNRISGYLSDSINLFIDLTRPLLAFTSIGINDDIERIKKSVSIVESSLL